MKDLETLQKNLGYQFRQIHLLDAALTHPSVTRANRQHGDNQRLEFLGDAVLQLAVSHYLFKQLQTAPEGSLTQWRASLVNRHSLETVARSLDLGKYLRLGRGEEQNSGRERPSNLADALEALIGAVFLDSDFPTAAHHVQIWFKQLLEDLQSQSQKLNAKGQLQELLQARGLVAPTYALVEISGPDHNRLYVAAVLINGQEYARGSGTSKKNAEIQAAANLLDLWKKNPEQFTHLL